jgi:hypothetical protein
MFADANGFPSMSCSAWRSVWLRRPADVSRNLTRRANHDGPLRGQVKLALPAAARCARPTGLGLASSWAGPMCSMSRDPRRAEHTIGDLINLAGKSAIVTGASSGIGGSTARLLHAAGPIRCWLRGAPAGWPR